MSDVGKYCVYLHRRKTDGTVFYIGSGVIGKRDCHFSGRSESWNIEKNKHGVFVDILEEGLTLDQAREREREIILSGVYQDLVNKRLPANPVSVSEIINIMSCVVYDESSPTFIRWTVITGPVSKNRGHAGTLSFDKKGLPLSSSVKIKSVMVKISRLIWILHGNDIPDHHIIDHIDGNPHNNNIKNLRCVSLEDNARNRKSQSKKHNELPKCISLKDGSFIVKVSCNGFLKSKSFSINKYGYELALHKAKCFRLYMLEEFGVLDSYTDRHIGFEVPDDIDFSQTSSAISGYSNIWTKRDKDGNVKSLSAGYLRTGRKYVAVNDKRTLNDALEICKEYLRTTSVAGTDSSSMNLDNAA